MASNSVNVPTNPKIKEQDVNAKLQLYGIYSAFANGKVPSNKQIDVAMNTAYNWKGFTSPSKRLSAEGQALTNDLQKVIEQAKLLLLSKNEGNLIQDFIWQTQQIGAGDAQKPGAPIDKDTAKQHGNQALEGLRTLGQLLITNGQFRKLLSDASVLIRDIAGDAAQNAANKVNPSEDQLQNIDRPAEDNVWHEAPNLSKDNLKSQVQSRVPIGKKDLDRAGQNAAQATNPDGSTDPADAAQRAAQDQQQGTSQTDPRAGASAAAKDLKETASANMDEKDKQKAKEVRQKTENYLKGKMPKERREQLIWRLKKMVVEIQGHQDYSQAIDTILRLAEEYSSHGKNLASQSTSSVKGAHNQDSLQLAEADLKTLLERFANSTSFDDLTDSINQIYRDAEQDPELKGWFSNMNRFIRRCLKEQGYIIQDDSNTEWNKLYDQGQFLLRDRYRDHTNKVTDEIKFLAKEFDNDPQNKAFAQSMNKLFNDLGHDADGKPEFKPHLVKDLTDVILPAFFENIRYVPIPRIEYSDSMMDAVVENLVIEGDNLAPNVFEFGSDNYWRWGRKQVKNSNKNKVMLSVSGIQCDLRDVSYYIKKKEGFPSVTDKGVMDVFMGGTGLSFKVAMETSDKKANGSDKAHFFKINHVDVDISHLNIKLKQSNHKLLFGLFKPLLLKVMRPVIQKIVEQQVRQNVNKLDAMLYAAKQEADRAQAEAKRNPDPENIQNMYQRYFTAFQKQMSKGQQKKEDLKASAADKSVNVAMTQHDSIFKNIQLPGGISTKATEYKDLAAKGDKWESPVFSIGSASETSNLPRVSKPTRKPHSTAPGGLRDAGHTQGSGAGIMGGNTGSVNKSSEYANGGVAGLGGAAGIGGASDLGGANSAGFANQVDNAFGVNPNSVENNATGHILPGQAPTTADQGQHTLLRDNNPVYRGAV